MQRWLAKVMFGPAPAVRTVRLQHGGAFRTSLEDAWGPIRGEQYFTADPPACLWWGRIRMAPAVWVDGVDSSIDGAGRMRVRVFSRFSLVDARGPDLDQGALVRLLGEKFWLPPALADRRHVSWTPVDDRSATATLRVGGRTASGTFELRRARPVRSLPRRATSAGPGVLTRSRAPRTTTASSTACSSRTGSSAGGSWTASARSTCASGSSAWR